MPDLLTRQLWLALEILKIPPVVFLVMVSYSTGYLVGYVRGRREQSRESAAV